MGGDVKNYRKEKDKRRNLSEQLVDKDQILLITAVTFLYTLFFSSLFHSQFSLPHP